MHKKTLMKILLLFSLIAVNLYVFAQPRVITFESEQKSKDSKIEKNVFKVSLFELASGDFPIYYERVLGKKISIEGSAGITFGDYFGGLLSDNYYSPLSENVDSKYGYSLSISFRFYPIEALEEFYIAPEFKYRKYNWDREAEFFPDYEPFYDVRNVSESRVYNMPRISFGYAFFYDTNLSFDYYLGIGMNTPTERLFDTELLKVQEEKRNTRPRVHFGLKIGYVF